MRILIVGSDNEFAIETYYYHALIHNPNVGFIQFFPSKSLFYKYYHQSVFHKILFKLGVSRILKSINSDLKLTIDKVQPDIVLVFKGMEIFPTTLQWIKSKSIKLVNYNSDSPFLFSGVGSGNRNIKKSFKLYDLFITYDSFISDQSIREFQVNSAVLPFGYYWKESLDITTSTFKEMNKLCFIGNEEKSRIHFINQLAAQGIPIDVYGHWKKKNLHKNINYLGYLPNQSLSKVLPLYRIQLNLLRAHNIHSHNMRSFEIPSSGGIQLVNETDDHLRFFKKGLEVFTFTSFEECVSTINYLMSITSEEANAIRRASIEKCKSKGYSYAERATQLYSMLKTVLTQ